MGLKCNLSELFTFLYKADVGDGLKEHEFDYVLIGTTDENPVPNPQEVAEYKYVGFDWVVKDVEENPASYTEWFKIALKELVKRKGRF